MIGHKLIIVVVLLPAMTIDCIHPETFLTSLINVIL